MFLENYIANQYIRAIIIFAALLIILRVAASILERTLLKLAKKTKTELDEIIIQKSSKPITIILFFMSLAIAINELTITENLLKNINAFIYSGIAIFVGYLIYVLIDIVVFDACLNPQIYSKNPEAGNYHNLQKNRQPKCCKDCQGLAAVKNGCISQLLNDLQNI